MARFLLHTAGSLGDLHPFLAIGAGLRGRGHEAAIATSPRYRARVEAAGLRMVPIRPDLDPEDPAIVALAIDPDKGSENVFREFVMPALRPAYEDLAAAAPAHDVLVSHPITLAGPLVGEKTGMPWASVVLSPISFMSVHEQIVFSGHPVVTALSAFGPLRRVVRALGRAMTRPWIRDVAVFRRELGLPPGAHPIFEGQHSPHLVLAAFSRALSSPLPDWPANAVQTGFCVYDGRSGTASLPPDLAAFLDAGEPPLVFTLGSSAVHDAGSFFVESAAAARALGRRAVFVAGDRRPAPPGPDIHVAGYVPYSLLFPRAAAVVSSAGVGTVGQVLAAGVPAVFCCYGNDQEDNAARVRRLGTGVGLPKKRYRADRVVQALSGLLAPGVRARAEQVRREVVAEPGVAAACDALVQLAGRGLRTIS